MQISRFAKALSFLVLLAVSILSVEPSHALDRLLVGDFEPQLEQNWHHQVFGSKTSYEFVQGQDGDSIKAQGNRSASGLFSDLSTGADGKENIEWQWRVDEIQASADLRLKEKEDFAASLFLVFSDSKGLFPSYKILIYAWSSMDLPVGTVISSPNDPDRVRTIVLGNNTTPLTEWVRENRNFMDDYREAFGSHPDKPLRTVGIFTDNDNTGEPVTSYYAPISLW